MDGYDTFIKWKTQYCENTSFTNVDLESLCNLSQNPSRLFAEIHKLILKFKQKYKKTYNSQNTL